MAAHAWLDAPPRPRPAIPSRDLAAGVAMSVGACALVLAIAASLEHEPPPPPDEPLMVSVGMLASTDARAGGSGGGTGRASKPGKRRGRKSSNEPASTTTPPPAAPSHHASSTSKLPPISVPSPWATNELPGLPGVGDLGEPVDGPVDGEGEGEGEGGGGSGEGGGGGEGDGGLAAYRSQLASWLAGHFHVEGSGLGAAALRKLRVRAVLELSDDRVVIGYSLTRTGTAAVDEAAERALEAVKGQPVPAPPAGLGSLQKRIHVVLTCRPDTCD